MESQEGSSDSGDIDLLVISLNDLLRKLHIPFPLDTPLDLTPSLLLAILECMLRSRLPVSDDIRASRDTQSKVQAMKVFIGVLENDIIGEDVGLGEVDPRKLAAGEWDEVVFIGQLLVWLGKKRGYISMHRCKEVNSSSNEFNVGSPKDHEKQLAEVRANAPSPSTHSTITTRNSVNTTLSMVRTAPPDSDTSVISIHPESSSLSDLDLFEGTPRELADTPTPPARRSPEPEGPSFTNLPGQSTFNGNLDTPFSPKSICDCPPEAGALYSNKRVPVRYSGWIERVDDDMEIQMFEARRRTSNPRTPSNHRRSISFTPKTPPSDFPNPSSTSTPRRPASRSNPGVLTRHTSPTQYHLALLNERAKLMSELAQIKGTRPR